MGFLADGTPRPKVPAERYRCHETLPNQVGEMVADIGTEWESSPTDDDEAPETALAQRIYHRPYRQEQPDFPHLAAPAGAPEHYEMGQSIENSAQ
jgi:hypothetical protein